MMTRRGCFKGKKILAFILIFLLICLLVCCSRTPKDDIFRIVEKEYNTILTACKAKDADALTPVGNGFQYISYGNTFYTEHIKGNIYFYSNAY
jgi:hypothetical protein